MDSTGWRRTRQALVSAALVSVVAGVSSGCYYEVEDDDISETPEVTATPAEDWDRDGYPVAVDCDDHDPAVSPGAEEVCNGMDDDCDGETDEDFALAIYYWDDDGDGYGGAVAGEWCDAFDPDTVLEDGDCDDGVASIHPGAEEVCNGRDDDCDGEVDEGLATFDYYLDEDGDGFGTGDPRPQCGDIDSSYAPAAGDCDDADPNVNPDAEEVCNGRDDDCDGEVDDADALPHITLYQDEDGDGYGNDDVPLVSCSESVSGYAAEPGDCDDTDASVHPGALDTCDGRDNDCDSEVDEDPETVFHPDADGDGYGDANSVVAACEQPEGTTLDARDCDDSNPAVSPDAEEIPDNDTDDNCDGLVDVTVDIYVTEDGVSPVPGSDTPVVTRIQDAIDMAYSGQIIGVGPGTYREHIDFLGKDVQVLSLQGPDVTVIDGENRQDDTEQRDSVVLFINGEGAGARISGFTITGGRGSAGDVCGYTLGVGTLYGGGICTRDSSPTIDGNVIEGNSVSGSGGGMYLDLGNPTVRNNVVRLNRATYDAAGISLSQVGGSVTGNVIIDNQAGRDGAGLYAFQSSPLIANNIIAFNLSEDTSGVVVAPGHGAGIALYESYPVISNNIVAYNEVEGSSAGGIWIANLEAGATLTNNTIVANTASDSAGGILVLSGEVTAQNNILAFNEAPNGANLFVSTSTGGNFISSYNLFYLASTLSGVVGATTDISDLISDPAFIDDPMDLDPYDDDYHLQDASPARDAGNPAESYQDPDGTTADLGAFGGPAGDDFTYRTMADLTEWLE